VENVVRSFLEFSRAPEPNLRTESINAIFEKTLELVAPRAEDRGIELARRDTPDLPPVLVDRDLFRQVLLNLLNNAMEAIDGAGRIEVGAAVERGPDGDRMMAVRVSDTGRGMAEEARNRIFEPFFSTKESGTGLGLCIAAGIVTRHRGRLVLESTGENGTVFTVYVPLAPEESA
jgi:signal transduction histidine kinase